MNIAERERGRGAFSDDQLLNASEKIGAVDLVSDAAQRVVFFTERAILKLSAATSVEKNAATRIITDL